MQKQQSVDTTKPLFDKCPGKISNNNLIDFLYFREGTVLKEDLIEHHDYEAVIPQVWEYLVSWHGFSDREPILRPIRYDHKKKRHYIDLYLQFNHPKETALTESFLDESSLLSK